MKKTLALLMCAALPAIAAAAQPDVEALKLNPQNKLYCNEQADWCVGIKLDGGFEDNGPLRPAVPCAPITASGTCRIFRTFPTSLSGRT